MKILTIIILLLLPIFSIGQNHELLGDSLHTIGQLKESIESYQKDLTTSLNKDKLRYKIAANFAVRKQVDSAFYYLNKAILNDSTERVLGDPDFLYLLEYKRWIDLVDNQVKKIEFINGPYKHLKVSKELWNMHVKDQAYYYHWDLAENVDYHSPLVRAVKDLKNIYNLENQKQLELIIEKYGYPTKSNFGKLAAGTAFLIIQHAGLKMQEKYINTIESLCKSKIIDCQDYALMYDRIELRNGRKQYYGTQLIRNKDNKLVPQPIKEEIYVEARRKQLGLFSLKEYMSYFGAEYTVEQKELPEE